MIPRIFCFDLFGPLVIVAVVLAGRASAGPPTPHASFEAKRVKPPAPGVKKRITVQIDPSRPATAARFCVTDSLVPEDNIAGGVKYLDWLMQKFDNDPILVLAGYNAGEGAVRKHPGCPALCRDPRYVPSVLAAFQVARGLCTTPPELISDGCVFNAVN